MSFRFKGKDFQAWADFDLTVEGLTVLIGPSNEGKSSLFRALKGLVRNELGQHYVRTGGTELDLTLEIGGHTVNATRTKKGSTTYLVDGQDFKKLGGAIPDEVQALGLNSMQIADTTLDPVFGKQSDRQFLLEETPMVLNSVLGKFSSTERLEQGKRTANMRIAEKNTEAKTIAKQMRDAEELKAKLAVLADRATEIMAVVDNLEPVVDRQQRIVVHLDTLIATEQGLVRLRKTIAAVPRISTVAMERQLATVVAADEGIVAQTVLLQLGSVAKRLKIPNVALVQQQAGIVEHASILAEAQEQLGINQRWFAVVDELIEVWTVVVSSYKLGVALDNTIALLEGGEAALCRSAAKRLAGMHKTLKTATEGNETLLARLEAISTLGTRIDALVTVRGSLRSCETDRAAAKERLSEMEAQIEAERQAAHACPHCGKDITTGENHEHSDNGIPARTQAGADNRKGARRTTRGAAA